MKILRKKIFGYLSKKIWFRVCSVTAEMFEHRNSGENRRKRSEIFFENLRRAYKDLIWVKKKFKIISCLCTFKTTENKIHWPRWFGISVSQDRCAKERVKSMSSIIIWEWMLFRMHFTYYVFIIFRSLYFRNGKIASGKQSSVYGSWHCRENVI